MRRNIYILIKDSEKKETLLRYLNINNKHSLEITSIFENLIFIKEEFTQFNELVNYHHIFEQFSNEIRTDLSILILNEGIFNDIIYFARDFLLNTFCKVYDVSDLINYCLITKGNENYIDEFFVYLSTLDEELLKSTYMYLDNNLNVLKTAKDLFIHRNTLNYRLNKIEFVTGLNIRNINSVCILHLFRIRHNYHFIK